MGTGDRLDNPVMDVWCNVLDNFSKIIKNMDDEVIVK